MKVTPRIISCLMVALLPASIMAQTHAAMLQPMGLVKVNGKSVDRSSAVLPGDNIQTHDKSMVTISAPGATLYVPSNSALTFAEGSVTVNSGGVLIATSNGMSAHISGVTVAPAGSGPARFEVAAVNGNLQVAAHQGSVTILDGARTLTLESGKAAVRALKAAPAVTAIAAVTAPPAEPAAAATAAAPATAPPAAAVAAAAQGPDDEDRAWKVIIIPMLVGGVAAAIAIVATHEGPASNPNP